jgi:hypothetical protein
MTHDAAILRPLAIRYYELAQSEKNRENLRLHLAVNDLHMIRPVVLLDELPWNELDFPDELALQCTDPYLREIEWFLRSNLFKSRHMPADMVFAPYLPIHKVVSSTGIGIDVEEDILATDVRNHIVAHRYHDILQSEADLARLHAPILSYDRKESLRRLELTGGILGDILPVRLRGTDAFHIKPWDDIARYRGVTELLVDLADRPDFSHAVVRKLTDIRLSELEQHEAFGLLDTGPYSLHCTAARTADLPDRFMDGTGEDRPVTRKDIWGRGMAQIFASVSKAMHEEFDIEYMLESIGTCGLAYYGCCEPLDRKIDIVARIPNLRKISITPWADVDVAAEAIGTKYVLASKPNPAAVAVPVLDKEALRKELGRILEACGRNGCSCDIVLKDISTCAGRPQNLFEWEKIAMDMVRNA